MKAMAERFLVASEFPNDNPALHHGAVWICPTVCSPPRAVVRVSPELCRGEAVATPEPRAFEERAPVEELAESSQPTLRVEASAESSEPTLRVEEPAESSEPALCEVVEIDLPEIEPLTDDIETLTEDDLELVDDDSPELCVVSASGSDAAPSAVSERQDDLELDDDDSPELCVVSASGPGAAPSAVSERQPADKFDAFVQAMVRVAMAEGGSRAALLLPRLLEGRGLDSALEETTQATLLSRGVCAKRGGKLVQSGEFSRVSGAWRAILRGTLGDFSQCGPCTLDEWGARILTAVLSAPLERMPEIRRALRRQGVAAFGMAVQAA